MTLNTGCKLAARTAIARSTSDRRRLLLQRFGEVGGALAQLAKQPRVLDGDDRLGGEILHQRDLLVGERQHDLAIDAEHADKVVFLEQRHDEKRACAGSSTKFT